MPIGGQSSGLIRLAKAVGFSLPGDQRGSGEDRTSPLAVTPTAKLPCPWMAKGARLLAFCCCDADKTTIPATSKDVRRRLANLLASYTPHDGAFQLRLPGTYAIRLSRMTTEAAYATLGPALCVAAQGAKVVVQLVRRVRVPSLQDRRVRIRD